MTELKQEHRDWALYLGKQIPGNLKVNRYHDEDNSVFIDIFTSRTNQGVIASTIGVMDCDLSRNPELHLFTEIVMDARGDVPIIENVLSTIAFYIVKNRWQPAPGVVFEDMVRFYDSDTRLPHVIFLPPFQWSSGMTRADLANKTIYPLLAVPITDSEKESVRQFGSDTLFNQWDNQRTDILNWSRA